MSLWDYLHRLSCAFLPPMWSRLSFMHIFTWNYIIHLSVWVKTASGCAFGLDDLRCLTWVALRLVCHVPWAFSLYSCFGFKNWPESDCFALCHSVFTSLDSPLCPLALCAIIEGVVFSCLRTSKCPVWGSLMTLFYIESTPYFWVIFMLYILYISHV